MFYMLTDFDVYIVVILGFIVFQALDLSQNERTCLIFEYTVGNT